MALKLHNLRPAKGAKKRKRRLGRGDASGFGSYSTRGMKGQRSRSGGKGGLKLRGMKAIIQSMPKIGGFKSGKPKFQIVNLNELDKNFKDKDIVTVTKLINKKLVDSRKPGIKILGDGKITKKLTVKIEKISASAIEAIEKAGGKVVLLGQVKKDAKEEKSDTSTSDKTDNKKKEIKTTKEKTSKKVVAKKTTKKK